MAAGSQHVVIDPALVQDIVHVATRMASNIGRAGEFCREKETFSAYVERMRLPVRNTWLRINASLHRREQFFLQRLVRKFTRC